MLNCLQLFFNFTTRRLDCLTICILLAVTIVLSPQSTPAEQDVVERDIDEDGKIDQVAYFDRRGRIIRLEIDNNADGVMDRFQYYEGEEIIRIERDSDNDRQIDGWTILRMGKCPPLSEWALVEAAKGSGSGLQIRNRNTICRRRTCYAEKDTSKDGRFDIITRFREGPFYLLPGSLIV